MTSDYNPIIISGFARLRSGDNNLADRTIKLSCLLEPDNWVVWARYPGLCRQEVGSMENCFMIISFFISAAGRAHERSALVVSVLSSPKKEIHLVPVHSDPTQGIC